MEGSLKALSLSPQDHTLSRERYKIIAPFRRIGCLHGYVSGAKLLWIVELQLWQAPQ